MEEQLTQNDVSLLNRFKAKATEFMAAIDKLYTIDNVPANLQEEYSGLISTANIIQGTISTITGTVDSVTGFFSDYFGFDGVSNVRDYINGNRQNNALGFVPLIPVALISGALAAMTKFISDVYVFERKITEQKRLESTGVNPTKAAEIVSKINGQSLMQNLTSLAKPIGFTIGLIVVSRFVGKMIK